MFIVFGTHFLPFHKKILFLEMNFHITFFERETMKISLINTKYQVLTLLVLLTSQAAKINIRISKDKEKQPITMFKLFLVFLLFRSLTPPDKNVFLARNYFVSYAIIFEIFLILVSQAANIRKKETTS